MLASLPDLSQSQGEIEAMSVKDARNRGLLSDASDKTLQVNIDLHRRVAAANY